MLPKGVPAAGWEQLASLVQELAAWVVSGTPGNPEGAGETSGNGSGVTERVAQGLRPA